MTNVAKKQYFSTLNKQNILYYMHYYIVLYIIYSLYILFSI